MPLNDSCVLVSDSVSANELDLVVYLATVDTSGPKEFDLGAYDHFVDGEILVLATDGQVRELSRC